MSPAIRVLRAQVEATRRIGARQFAVHLLSDAEVLSGRALGVKVCAMNDPGVAQEVAKIEHELDILHDRLARFSYWSGIVRVWIIFFWIFLAVFGLVGLVYICAKAFTLDFTVGVFAAVMSAVAVAIAWLLWRVSMTSPRRWIDLVSELRTPSWGGGLSGGRYISEAEAIEDMIANREARLTVLKAQSARSSD